MGRRSRGEKSNWKKHAGTAAKVGLGIGIAANTAIGLSSDYHHVKNVLIPTIKRSVNKIAPAFKAGMKAVRSHPAVLKMAGKFAKQAPKVL